MGELATFPDDRKMTTAEAARFLNMTFHSMVYNVGVGNISPVEKTSQGTMLFLESDVRKLAELKGIAIAAQE